MTQVKIYTKSDCELCEKTKVYFAERPHIQVVIVPVELQAERDKLYDKYQREGKERLMPQIVIIEPDGTEHPIGGYKDVINNNIDSLFL